MGYTQRYTKVINESVTINYPASEKGGSKSASISIPIEIEIDVDTLPFERSVGDCNSQINLLTGSVVIAETAQIAAKIENASQVSNSIIDGFFGLIKSEINQQISEIKPRVEALIIELVKHQENCVGKKIQLEGDFNRIADRYSKIFNELDKELYNRVQALNKSTFVVQGQINSLVTKSYSEFHAGIATIFHKEGSNLHSIVYASKVKKKAMLLIENAENYLISEKNLSSKLKMILSGTSQNEVSYVRLPVIFTESTTNKEVETNVHSVKEFGIFNPSKAKLTESFLQKNQQWKTIGSEPYNKINTFFQLELSKVNESASDKDTRLSETIMGLWNNNKNINTNY